MLPLATVESPAIQIVTGRFESSAATFDDSSAALVAASNEDDAGSEEALAPIDVSLPFSAIAVSEVNGELGFGAPLEAELACEGTVVWLAADGTELCNVIELIEVTDVDVFGCGTVEALDDVVAGETLEVVASGDSPPGAAQPMNQHTDKPNPTKPRIDMSCYMPSCKRLIEKTSHPEQLQRP